MSGVVRGGLALGMGLIVALCVAGLPSADASGPTSEAGRLVAAARKELGRPACADAGGYRGPTLAACGVSRHLRGFDAASLTAYAVFQATGKRLALTVAAQYRNRGEGISVKRAELLAGDVVFWHGLSGLGVGVYLGYGLIIDAAPVNHVVKIEGLSSHFLAGVRYWSETKPATSTTTVAGVPTKSTAAPSTMTGSPAAPVSQATTSATTPTMTTPAASNVPETAGSEANTWTDYEDAGGTAGPEVADGETLEIACRIEGFKVSDGNVWWYQIESAPWSNGYYVSADAFYNNGETSGTLRGTPFYDPAVSVCAAPNSGSQTGAGDQTGVAETTGSEVNTWTDYQDAGGTQGPTIASNDTVYITCRVEGFEVSDGNTWWYEIASSPWSNSFYGSADAFYNNGATSGTLSGTPFYDPAVPVCPSS